MNSKPQFLGRVFQVHFDLDGLGVLHGIGNCLFANSKQVVLDCGGKFALGATGREAQMDMVRILAAVP